MEQILDEILKAEAEAEKIIQDSRESAQELVRKGEEKASEIVSRARNEAATLLREGIEEVKTRLQKQKNDTIAEVEKENELFLSSNGKRIEEVSEKILQLIAKREY